MLLHLYTLVLLSGCTTSSGDSIDKIFGSSAPILTTLSNKIIPQNELLKIDFNNVKESSSGTDEGMTYTCYYDRVLDGEVTSNNLCSSIPNAEVSFNTASGILNWTPAEVNSNLGIYELKVTGKNKNGESVQIFTVDVRLKFNGLTTIQNITGTTADLLWTPNLNAVAYQVYKTNALTGIYELLSTIPGGSSAGGTIAGLYPNTTYTLRVQAVDILGSSDGNIISASFVTTQLVKLSMASSTTSGVAGTPISFTVQAYNADDSPQTIGGLTLTPAITSGTSTGIFSAVTDNHNGTYSFSFTPTIVGTAPTIAVTTITTNFYLINSIALTVMAGPANSVNSTISASANTVVSGNSVTISTLVRDQYNNPIISGATISFSASGGTSTGLFGTVNNLGAGVYTVTYTGVVAGTAKNISMSSNAVALATTTSVMVTPGVASSAMSTLTVSISTLPSGTNSVVTAVLRDNNSNPIPSGILVAFNKSGGTSTGTFSAVVNAGNGSYTANYNGVLAGSAQTISVSVDGATLTPTASIAVVPGSPFAVNSNLILSSATVVSGTYVTATALIKDVNNNPIDSGIVVSFTKTGGTSTGTFGSVNNQGSGEYSIRYTGVTSGTAQSIQTQVGGVDFDLPASVIVLNAAPSSLNSILTVSSNSITSGTSSTITATLRDLNSNLVTSGYTIAFNKSGGTATGTISAVTNNGDGTYTAAYTGILAGSAQTISVSVDGGALSATDAITVTPAAPSLANSTISISGATVVSGSFVTVNALIRDLNNNLIDSGIVVSLTKTGGTSTGTLGSVNNLGAGQYSIRYTGVTSGTAQSLQLKIDGSNFGAAQGITVLNGSPSEVTSTLVAGSPTISSGSSITLTATLRDDNNNLVASGYAVTFTKSGGTATGTFSTFDNNGDGTYTTTYTGITAGTAQTINVLIDGIALGRTVTIGVIPGAPSSLLSTLSISANSIVAGATATLTATIKDSNSNPISSGILVMFDKLGGTSFGNYGVVTNQGNGVYTVTYNGVVAGTAQTVQANVNGLGFGPTQSIQVTVGTPSLAHSTLILSANTVTSNAAITATAVIRDSENNPITNEYIIAFDAIGGSSTGTISAVNNLGGGSFSVTYTGINAGTAQTIRIFADGSQILGLTDTIGVIPGAVSAIHSTFTIATLSSATIQSTSSASLDIHLRDINSNNISDPTTVVSFVKTSSVSDGTISAVSNLGSGNYSATYTATTMGTAQTIALYVNGSSTGMSVSATVTAGPPTQITISSPVGVLNSIDCNGPYTGTLKDQNGNITVSNSTVSITLTSSPISSHVGMIFTDALCTSSASSLSVPVSTSTFTFYYKSYRPQSITLTLTPNLGIAALGVSITNIAVLSWMGSSAYFTMNGSGSQTAYDDSSGGSYTPQDAIVYGGYLYVADITTHRIVKYDITTNSLVGWIGHVGSVENISAYDASVSCTGLSVANADLTPKWCVGGRSNMYNSPLLLSPRNLTTDGTYLYVASSSRILRFLLSDGSYKGWYGKINTVVGMTDNGSSGTVCSSAGIGATTPMWCYGGTHITGIGDGQFNVITGLLYLGNYLYVTDINNQRIERIDISGANPVFSGWIGQINTVAGMTDNGSTGVVCSSAGIGGATPQWCYGGTSRLANRYNLATTPVEVAAPNEGYYNPRGLATDGTYLYVADSNNYRIVRNDLVSGAFAGWIGNARAATATNPSTPSYGVQTYTTNWTTGGIVAAATNATNGFNYTNYLYVDTSVIPNILYFTETGGHRLGQIRASDGQGLYKWIGRNSVSPTGGNVGCSSSAVGATNPGWCVGGAAGRYGNTNGTFYNPTGFAVTNNKIYVTDSTNARVQRFDKTSGVFDGWIGTGSVPASTWSRSLASGTIAARAGFDDYSLSEYTSNASWYAGLTSNGTYMFQTDVGFNRIKKFNFYDGSVVGYVGTISGFGPTGPGECVGYTSGFTPAWCTGGGRTTSATTVHGYNNPFSIASDSNYIYVGDYSNSRVDRIRISDGTYMGWLGYISTSPTDGESTCTGASTGTYTPGWCIGGAAGTINTNLGFTNPRAMYYDSAVSLLYINDNTGRLIRINPSSGAITGIIGSASAVTGCSTTSNVIQGWCTTATGTTSNSYGGINSAAAIASNSNYIFVADMGYNRINRYDKATGAPAGFIGNLTNATNVNTASTTVTINGLTTTNGCYNVTTGYPRGTPGWCFGNAIGIAVTMQTGNGNGQFNSPRGIWADDNNVFVSDYSNNRIMKFNATTGAFVGWKGYISSATGMSCLSGTPVAGSVTPDWCTGGTSGPGKTLGAFDALSGLTGDSSYIYILDTRNNRTVAVPR